MSAALLQLPYELLSTIASHLDPEGLERTSRACRLLRTICLEDSLWRNHIQDIVPYKLPAQVPAREGVARLIGQRLIRPGNVTTWFDVWRAFHHFWFILKRRFWISDHNPGGGLVIVLFDLDSLQIKGYRLIAQNNFDEPPTFTFTGQDMQVGVMSFAPVLTRHRESFSITHPGPWTEPCSFLMGGQSYGHLNGDLPPEIRCSTPPGSAVHLQKILLAKDLPTAAIGRTTSVWPPQCFPSQNRVRNPHLGPSVGMTLSYHPDYETSGYRPANFSERSLDAFRITSSPRSISQGYGRYVGITPSGGETLAAIDSAILEPTPEKPLQGIWIGDYNGHGNEFILFMQPDNDKSSYFTMPEHAQATLDEILDEDGRDAMGSEIESPYKGLLVGVKLTGDRNVPRSENTFIVPDLGKILRVATETAFKDALVVRGVAHTAGDMFMNDQYSAAQMFIISEARVAFFWEELGHISYFVRAHFGDYLTRYPPLHIRHPESDVVEAGSQR